MKHVDEYRDGRLARALAVRIASEAEPATHYHFMEFCGGHTHAISRSGIEDLLPHNTRLIHGPGCPVCMLPMGRIDAAIRLAERREVTLCAYGDLMRVPGSHGTSLLRAKAAGADFRTVYSTLAAIRSADGMPGLRDVLFGPPVRLYDAHPAAELPGRPGEVVAGCDGAFARVTCDGAGWIGHVREERDNALKLLATHVFAAESADLPAASGYAPIRYEEEDPVGYLHFAFYNGAMSTAQCGALRAAYTQALTRPTRALVLMGDPDY